MPRTVITNGMSGLVVRNAINTMTDELYSGVDAVTVNTYADLPAPSTATGERWWVLTTTGTRSWTTAWLLSNVQPKGAYRSDGTAWVYLGDFPVTAAELGNVPAGDISATNVQAAINELDTEKAPINSPTFTGTVAGVTKAMVGLGNVDNTSDANKPVSTAQATALAGKAGTGAIGASGLTQATARLLGRLTAGTGAVEELTATQVTAQLDAFTSGAKGLVPASGGGTTNFLRADGAFAAPPGGGGGSITVEDEGTPLTTAVTLFNFVGAGVTVTEPVADQVTVTISGGGGGSIAVPTDTRSGAYTLVAGDAQRRQRVDGNVTVDNTVFTAGDIVMLHSYSASLIDVIQGSGVTLRIAGSTVTGTCKLGPRGVAILVFDSASDVTISGAVM